jgi:hypothetical protein
MTITRYIAAATLATCVLAAAPHPSLKAARTHGSGYPVGQPSVSYSESLVEEILDPSPAPASEDPPERGPFVAVNVVPTKVGLGGRTSIEFYFGCEFSIWDNNEGLWDWTYEARLFDPSNNQIKYATNWANDKTGYSSNLGHNIIDPAEGTYRARSTGGSKPPTLASSRRLQLSPTRAPAISTRRRSGRSTRTRPSPRTGGPHVTI